MDTNLDEIKNPRSNGMGWRHKKARRALNARFKDNEANIWKDMPPVVNTDLAIATIDSGRFVEYVAVYHSAGNE